MADWRISIRRFLVEEKFWKKVFNTKGVEVHKLVYLFDTYEHACLFSLCLFVSCYYEQLNLATLV